MPIIKPTKSFAGSALINSDAGKYIKPDVRQVLFNKNNNKQGAHLYFLPPYKADAEGNGVWYKVIKIRDNFGDKFKDKYVVALPDDPVAHFERNFKIYFPEDAAVTEEMDTNSGRMQKRYPFCGRVTTRVLFNVAYTDKLELGSHVLDLPSYNGASLLLDWMNEKDSRGRERPVINDPENAIPVFLKLNDGAGAPWRISPDATDPGVLPATLADSDYLYNLDEVFIIKTKAELISKLQQMYAADVFEQCMTGYPGFDKKQTVIAVTNPSAQVPVARTEAPAPVAPKSKAAPAVSNIPKATISKSAPVDAVIREDSPQVVDITNPLTGVSADEAERFLRE